MEYDRANHSHRGAAWLLGFAIQLCSCIGLLAAATSAHAASQDSIAGLALQSNGKIVAAGLATSDSFGLARYNTSGALDPSFAGDGKTTEDFGSEAEATSIALQPDGKVVVAGTAGDPGDEMFAVARYNSDGTPDTSFSGDGLATIPVEAGLASESFAFSVVVQADGAIVVAGTVGSGGIHAAVVRLLTDGSLDPTFSENGILTFDYPDFRVVTGLALQADGKIIAAGIGGGGITGDEAFHVVRLSSDGGLDPSFSGDGSVVTAPADFGSASAVTIQSDGKIVVAGDSGDAYTNDFTAIRYNTDGSLDPSFSSDGIATADVGGFDIANSVAIQADGAILVGGHEWGSFAVARFLPNGALDSSFAGDGVLTDHPGYDGRSVAVQADGTILIGGDTADCCGDPSDFALSRYTSAGTKDASFGMDGDVTTNFSEAVPPEEEPTPSEADDEPAPPAAMPAPPPVLNPATPTPGKAFFGKIGQVRGKKALIRTRCAGDTACRGVAKLLARVATKRAVTRRGNRQLRRRTRNVLIGKSRFNIAPRKAGVLRVRLTRVGKKLVRRSGRRGLRVRLVGRGLKSRTVTLKPRINRSARKRR